MHSCSGVPPPQKVYLRGRSPFWGSLVLWILLPSFTSHGRLLGEHVLQLRPNVAPIGIHFLSDIYRKPCVSINILFCKVECNAAPFSSYCGPVSMCLFDKTGTLTMNKPNVAHLWMDNQIGEVDTAADDKPAFTFDETSSTWKNIARAATLCNRAEFSSNTENKGTMRREVIGTPLEGSMLRLVEGTFLFNFKPLFEF